MAHTVAPGAASGADTVPLARVTARQHCRVAGVIETMTRSVPGNAPRLDITVTDGAATVAARFLGQREVPGLFPGRVVELTGSFCAEDGSLVVFNPGYQLLAPAADARLR